jgi:peptide-methionine (S)-S-oxide reductase
MWAGQIYRNMEKATLGAGCFWCIEAIFKDLNGVYHVEPGYSGGIIENPTYEEVCKGSTNHAEVCRILFNPSLIKFSQLLDMFWSIHDPTSLNKQGEDIGTQYRSVIFTHTDIQREIAKASLKRMDEINMYSKPIVTEISHLENYYPAENYHYDYYKNNPNNPYCSLVIKPKVDKFKKWRSNEN